MSKTKKPSRGKMKQGILEKALLTSQQTLYFIRLNDANRAKAVLEETILNIMQELGVDRTWKLTTDASHFVKAEEKKPPKPEPDQEPEK